LRKNNCLKNFPKNPFKKRLEALTTKALNQSSVKKEATDELVFK